MALVISDRVKETTATTGTGTYTLGGAVTGFETFASNLADGDTTYYACTDNTDFEVGLGTINEGASQTINYTVTVANVGGINVFVLNGVNNPVITFVRGFTYVFDVSDNTNGSHPLRFRTSADASYTDGVSVSGTQGQAGSTVTIVVASDAPSTLKYYCTIHGNAMGNTINVISDVATLERTTILASSNSGSAVNWSTGTRTIFCTLPAAKAVFLDASGNTSVSGSITADSFIIGNANINENDLESIDDVTAGTVSASKAAVVDINKDITGFRNVTLTGELDAATLDISGDADIDGTLEADAMTLNGTPITTTATLSTGISNGNVLVADSTVADDDFLRINGTSVEGRSASEVLNDIGATTLTEASDEATALAIALG